MPECIMEMWNGKYFADLLKGLELFFDEVYFIVDYERLKLVQFSSDRVTMTVLNIPKHCFDTFETDIDGLLVPVNLKHFKRKLLKNVRKGEMLRLEYNAETGAKISAIGAFTKMTSYNLNDDYYSGEKEPQVQFKAKVDGLPIRTFKEIVDMADEEMKLVVNEGRLDVYTSGVEMPEQIATITEGDLPLACIECVELQESYYSSGYIRRFVKAVSKLSDTVSFSFSTDMPIMFQSPILNGGYYRFWQAPRIHTDDEEKY